MADNELDAIRAEIRRREGTSGTTPVAASFSPGERMAEDPELAVIRAEIKRREQSPPLTQGPQEQVQLDSGASEDNGPTKFRRDLPGNVAASLPGVVPEVVRNAVGSAAGALADVAPESMLPQADRIDEYEQLPDILRAPAIRSARGAVALFTNSTPQDREQILKEAMPGTEVHRERGYEVYTFPGDPQRYAIKSGPRLSDFVRAAPAVVGSALAGAGVAAATGMAPLSIPVAVVANVLQSLLGEGAQVAAGGNFDKLPVAASAIAPTIVPALKVAEKAAGTIVSKAMAPVGQKADTLVDPLVQKTKDVLVGLGANPDASGLAQDVASMTGPAAANARAAANQAAIDAEAAATGAAARAEADTAVTRTAAKDAIEAVRTRAQDTSTQVTHQLQDDVAAASARAAANKAAAQAPVDSVVDSMTQALQKWGAGETSSLDKEFLDTSMKFLDGLKSTADNLYKEFEEKFPEGARVQPGKAFDALQEWLDKKLAGRDPSAFLKRVKKNTGMQKKGNAVQMPQAIDITREKQRASAIGHKGLMETADISEGEAKAVAALLAPVEDKVARDHGLGGLLDDAQSAWEKYVGYRDEMEKVLTLRGEKALRDGGIVPALDAAGAGMRKGYILPAEQIMAAAPPGMKQKVMANIVARVTDPSKGPEHVVAAIKALSQGEVNGLVFKNLPAGARKQLLSHGADLERALAKRADDIATAEAVEAAETRLVRRTAGAEKRTIHTEKLAETRAVRETEAEALSRIAKEKADDTSSAARAGKAAGEAAAQAEKLDIALAPKLKSAGNSLLDGDIRPFDEMVKSAPGRRGELAASTLYHALVDPADTGPEALKRITEGLVKLEANPVAFGRIKAMLPNAADDIGKVSELAKIVYGGTKAGGTRPEGPLAALASLGAWAGGRTGGTLAALGTAALGGGVLATGTAGAGGYVLGRILASRFAKDSTIETKAANALLASDAGKTLLRHFALEEPVTQGFMRRMAEEPVVKAAARVYGMRPEAFLKKLAGAGETTVRTTGERRAASGSEE